MSNVEHPKHYQLSIDLEPLDLIAIVLYKMKLRYLDALWKEVKQNEI